MRYGDIMKPLVVDELALADDMRADPDVQRYIQLLNESMRAEKVSDPADWTGEETATYARGDWVGFSRLRGYTPQEIDTFQQQLDLCHQLIARYGDDDVAWISYTLHEQTGILDLTPRQILGRDN